MARECIPRMSDLNVVFQIALVVVGKNPLNLSRT